MKRTIPTLILAISALAIAAPLAAQQSLPRSASGGSGQPEKGPGAVPVPRHPYAGNWDGTLAIDGAKAPVKVAIAFKVADAERQSYSGETTIDGRGQAHLNVSSVPAEDTQAKTADAPIARRSPGGGQPAASSLADGSAGERDTLAKGDHALLLFHSPTKTMVLCDEGHRCIALAKLTWDETAADGKRYAYRAMLVSPDTINGTVKISKDGRTETGTFSLARQK
jgi:hypothetical protein